MNQIFRVIWNHATQSWVAVSELSSAKGKTKSKTNKVMLASLVVGSSIIASHSIVAAELSIASANNISVKRATEQDKAEDKVTMNGVAINGSNIYITQGSGALKSYFSGNTLEDTIVIGSPKSGGAKDGQILIGNHMVNGATGNLGDVVIGNHAIVGGGNQDSMGTGVGYGIQVAGPSVAMGIGARADIYDSSGWNAVKNGGTAIGAYSLIGGNKNGGTAVGAISAAERDGAVAVGTLSGSAETYVDHANRGLGYRPDDTKAQYTTSIGYKSGARGQNSVAVGVNAYTGLDNTSNGTVAVGNSTRAYGEGSMALGNLSVAGSYTDDAITALTTKKETIEKELKKAGERLQHWKDEVEKDASAYNKFNLGNMNAIIARLELTLERTKDDLTRAATAKGITGTPNMPLQWVLKLKH